MDTQWQKLHSDSCVVDLHNHAALKGFLFVIDHMIYLRPNLFLDSIEIFKYVKNYLNNNKYNNGISIMGRSLGSASACHIISKYRKDSII